MATSTDTRKAELFARTSTTQLVGAMIILDAATTYTSEERLTLAWIRGEIERRIPAVSTALEQAFLAAELEEERTGKYVDVDYGAVMLAAIPA